MSDNFADEFEQGDAPQETARITQLAHEAVAVEETVASLEAALKEAKKRLQQILTHDVPGEMDRIGLPEFKLESGFRISLEDKYTGSLPKEEEARADALDWLEDNGGGPLIKCQIKADFEKGQAEIAQAALDELIGKGASADLTEGVHAQTLYSFLRELVKRGEEAPLDKLGVSVIRRAKISKAK